MVGGALPSRWGCHGVHDGSGAKVGVWRTRQGVAVPAPAPGLVPLMMVPAAAGVVASAGVSACVVVVVVVAGVGQPVQAPPLPRWKAWSWR